MTDQIILSSKQLGFKHWQEVIERFPYTVDNHIYFGSRDFPPLRDWLDAQVGAHNETWHGLTIGVIRFKHESDAISFKLTWG